MNYYALAAFAVLLAAAIIGALYGFARIAGLFVRRGGEWGDPGCAACEVGTRGRAWHDCVGGWLTDLGELDARGNVVDYGDSALERLPRAPSLPPPGHEELRVTVPPVPLTPRGTVWGEPGRPETYTTRKEKP